MGIFEEGGGSESGNPLKPFYERYAESRKRARKKWRQSAKGKAWDKAYGQRLEVKARRKEYKIKRILKDLNEGI